MRTTGPGHVTCGQPDPGADPDDDGAVTGADDVDDLDEAESVDDEQASDATGIEESDVTESVDGEQPVDSSWWQRFPRAAPSPARLRGLA